MKTLTVIVSLLATTPVMAQTQCSNGRCWWGGPTDNVGVHEDGTVSRFRMAPNGNARMDFIDPYGNQSFMQANPYRGTLRYCDEGGCATYQPRRY